IPLYLRFFQPRGSQNLDRRMLIGLGLLSIAGLNIFIVAIVDVLSKNIILTSTAVVPWAGQVLWVPHHVAALVAGLTGFLVLWYSQGAGSTRTDVLASLAA